MKTVSEVKSETPMGILFVDDEQNILTSLRRLFMDEEYTIYIANSGEEALLIIDQHPDIGLIVSDQRMPGLTGVDFLEKAREILPDAIRILLTGYADMNAVVDAINRGGAYRYITKPWQDDELMQVINEAASRFSLLSENKRLQAIVAKQNDELQRWNSQLEYFVQEQTVEIQNNSKELEKLNEHLKNNFRNTIIAFSGLLELRDKKTRSHSKNVAAIASRIARSMKLPKDAIETITIAAMLHDIGKISMSDALMQIDYKEMDVEGQKEYMHHPVRGQAAIDSIEDLRPAGVMIRHHHEQFNGLGYPDALSTDKIPLGSRIISIADYFENTIRQYPGSEAVKITLNEVNGHLSTRFDPAIFPHLETVAPAIYVNTERTDMVEKELNVKSIKPGMILARDVRSGTGLVLLSKGMTLAEKNIISLHRYYQLDPSTSGIFVWMEN